MGQRFVRYVIPNNPSPTVTNDHVTESGDGKDEESSSEDAHFYYAMKMWGHISGDADMEARGNLILAILKRSFNNYFYLKADNKNHPEDFVLGMISGILFENKVHRITYFGDKQHLIHGIHMIPFTPITKYLKDPEWVRAEWEAFFSTPEKYGVVEFGWNGLLYSNLALIDPVKSFNYFKVKDFDKLFLDEVASLTYSLAYAARKSNPPTSIPLLTSARQNSGEQRSRIDGWKGRFAFLFLLFDYTPCAPTLCIHRGEYR